MQGRGNTRAETPNEGIFAGRRVWRAFGAAALWGMAVQVCRGDAGFAKKGRIGARRSPWFSDLGEGVVRCELCPAHCRLRPGMRGRCRVRENRGGAGYTLVFGTPCILQLDPIERKPFYHVLPASRSFSVSTAGCNFACKFCQVWDTALVAPEEVHAHDASPEDVVRHAQEANARSVAYTFGEPVAFFEYMLATARLARRAGLLNLLHSNGYICREPLKVLVETLDAANVDLKGFDRAFYRDVCGGERDPVLETLKTLKAGGIHIEITNLLVPTLNDGMPEIREMCRWIGGELGVETPLHFSRFYPLYQLANLPPTPVLTLNRARETAFEAGLRYVYVSNVPGHEGENTLCPGCGQVLIQRIGFMVEDVRIERGNCAHCGRRVPGIWSQDQPMRRR